MYSSHTYSHFSHIITYPSCSCYHFPSIIMQAHIICPISLPAPHYTALLLLPVPYHTTPAAYTTPCCSCYLCHTMVVLLPVLHCGGPAAYTTPWWSCCLCCTVVLPLPVPHCGAPTACA